MQVTARPRLRNARGAPGCFTFDAYMFDHDYLFPGVTNQGHEGSETELFRQVLRGDNRSGLDAVCQIGIAYRAW